MVGMKIVKQNITQLTFFNQPEVFFLYTSGDLWTQNFKIGTKTSACGLYSHRFTLMKMSLGDPFDTNTCD